MSLKSKLRARSRTFGSWLSWCHDPMIELMSNGPLGWLVVDLEHTTLEVRDCERAARICQPKGVELLARLSSHDPAEIKKVLDLGADGFIAPMVTSLSEVEQICKAAFYPPDGQRGVGLSRAQGYGENFNAYYEKSLNDTVFIAQIEHVDAMDQLEAILAHPKVDGIIIGPYDLSASLGAAGDFNHPAYLAAYRQILKAARNANVACGLHLVHANEVELASLLDEGFTFFALSTDMLIFTAQLNKLQSLIEKYNG